MKLILVGLFFWIVFVCMVFSQASVPTPGVGDDTSRARPTPTPGTAEDWWSWCLKQDIVVHRVSNKHIVTTGGGTHLRRDEERLKMPAKLTPFGSMRKWRSYKEIKNGDIRCALRSTHWNYQTLDTTGIGNGNWTRDTWRSTDAGK